VRLLGCHVHLIPFSFIDVCFCLEEILDAKPKVHISLLMCICAKYLNVNICRAGSISVSQ
jgi:hypothetical protein